MTGAAAPRRTSPRAALIFLLSVTSLGIPFDRILSAQDRNADADVPPPRPAVEAPESALARLDSLMQQVAAEEARTRESPREERSWARLARAWFQVGDHDRAVAALDRARALGAGDFETLLLLGRAARSEMRFEEAAEWLRRAVRARTDDWEGREDLGLALYLSGDLAGAAEQWERASALPGSSSPDRGRLISALRRVGNGAYAVTGSARERLPFRPHRRRVPAIEVIVNGRGPYLFQIEGGSSEAVIGLALAHELGLATEIRIAAEDSIRLPAAVIDYVTLDLLRLGATTLARLPCAVSRSPSVAGPTRGAGREVCGILGFEVLRRFRFCIDYPESALWIAPARDTLAAPWIETRDQVHPLRAWLRGTRLIHAEARLGNGPPRPWVLDTTGPGVFFTAPISTLSESGVSVDTSQVLSGMGTGGEVSFYRTVPATLCLGSACRDSVPGLYGLFPAVLEWNPNFRAAGVVSEGFLSRYRYEVHIAQGSIRLIEPGR